MEVNVANLQQIHIKDTSGIGFMLSAANKRKLLESFRSGFGHNFATMLTKHLHESIRIERDFFPTYSERELTPFSSFGAR